MTNLLAALDQLGAGPWASVLWIGVGSGDGLALPRPTPPGQPRLVLVEADPFKAAALRRRTAGQDSVQVVASAAVAGHASSITWQRWRLPALDGPVDWRPLAGHYPRLAVLESNAMPARPIGELADETVEEGERSAANALILDVPGQEDALLEALGEQRLQRYRAIVLRRCAALPREAGAGDPMAGLSRLGFAVAADSGPDEPLWPWVVLHFDERLRALALAHEAAQAAEDRARELAEGLATTRQALDAERRRADEADRAARAAQEAWLAASEHQRKVTGQLADALERLRQVDLSLHAHVEHARSREELAKGEVDATRKRIAELEDGTARLKALVHAARSLEAERDSLQAELAQAKAGSASAQADAAAKTRLLSQATSQTEALWQDKRELQDVVSQQAVELETLRLSLQAHERLVVSLRRDIALHEGEHATCQALGREVADLRAALEAERAEGQQTADQLEQALAHVRQQDIRQQQLREELSKAEGQVDILRTLMLSDFHRPRA